MSAIRITTCWAQRPLSTAIKATARMSWNDEIASFISTTQLASRQSKRPHFQDVVVAGACAEVPWWWGQGGRA